MTTTAPTPILPAPPRPARSPHRVERAAESIFTTLHIVVHGRDQNHCGAPCAAVAAGVERPVQIDERGWGHGDVEVPVPPGTWLVVAPREFHDGVLDDRVVAGIEASHGVTVDRTSSASFILVYPTPRDPSPT